MHNETFILTVAVPANSQNKAPAADNEGSGAVDNDDGQHRDEKEYQITTLKRQNLQLKEKRASSPRTVHVFVDIDATTCVPALQRAQFRRRCR